MNQLFNIPITTVWIWAYTSASLIVVAEFLYASLSGSKIIKNTWFSFFFAYLAISAGVMLHAVANWKGTLLYSTISHSILAAGFVMLAVANAKLRDIARYIGFGGKHG